MPGTIKDFFSEKLDSRSRWLIVGKGPSASRWREVRQPGEHILTLNHAIRIVDAPSIAHFIDLTALEESSEYLSSACQIVLPWRPHIDNKPTDWTLEGLLKFNPVLADIHVEQLATYNASTAKKFAPFPASPVVEVRYFSAEAALNLLAMSGVKYVRAIGLDGGKEYAQEFSDLQPLTNGQESFDKQFRQLDKIVKRYKLEFERVICHQL